MKTSSTLSSPSVLRLLTLALSLSALTATSARADENDDLLERLEGKATLEQQQARKRQPADQAPKQESQKAEPSAHAKSFFKSLKSNWSESKPTQIQAAGLSGGASESGAFLKATTELTNETRDSQARIELSAGSPVLRLAGQMKGIPIEIQQVKFSDSTQLRFILRPIDASAMLTLPEGAASGRQHLMITPEVAAQLGIRSGKFSAQLQLSTGPALGGACDGDACGVIVGAKIGASGEATYAIDEKATQALHSKLSLEKTFSLMDSLKSASSTCLELGYSHELNPKLKLDGGVYFKNAIFDMVVGEGARNSDDGIAFEGGVFGKVTF